MHTLPTDISSETSFLSLLSHSSPSDMRVPTLDVDLVWHTHQLFAKTYEREVGRIVGRFVNQFVDILFITSFSDFMV